MNVNITTDDPDAIDPAEIAKILEDADYFVATVNVNGNERQWKKFKERI